MQYTLFALIDACIKQAVLNRNLNLLSISADISTRRPTIGTRSTTVFRGLTTAFRTTARFRRILTRTQIAQEIVNASGIRGFLSGGRFLAAAFSAAAFLSAAAFSAAAFCQQPLSRRRLSSLLRLFQQRPLFLLQPSRQQPLSSQHRQQLSSLLPERLSSRLPLQLFLSISSSFFAASASAFF